MTSTELRLDPAFTLLEVMAAVAVLGLLYAVLGRVAIQGLGAEGESARRLEASLLADRVLSDLEAEVAVGTVPPVGENEYEEGDWLVRVRIAPFDLPFAASPPDEAEPPALLLSGGPASPLRSVEVRVSWVEGAAARNVSRTTYALDLSGVEALPVQPETPQ